MKRINLVLETLTPVSHGDTVTGVDNGTNVRLFMRQGMFVNGIPTRVPAISENALRSVLFRYPLADHLLLALEIGLAELPQAVVNLLFSGGCMLSGAKEPGGAVAMGHAVKRLYPSLDLLGGAVDGFILPRGRMRVAAWLVAREYARAIAMIAPEHESEAEQVSAYDLLTEETRTRGTGDDSDGNQMLYTYETLCAGAKVLVEITLDSHTPDEAAAAVWLALERWDGYFGGQSRQGRGRFHLHGVRESSADYLAHLEQHGAAMREGLVSGQLGTNSTLTAR